MNTRRLIVTVTLAMVLLAASAGERVMAASLASTSPAQPIPDNLMADNGPPDPGTFDTWSPGSTALVPVLTADSLAGTTAPAEADVNDAGRARPRTANAR